MSYASDDLTPLFGGQPGPGVGYRQGIIRAWNPLTAENTVEVGGDQAAVGLPAVLVENLPILNTNEALLLQPGDVVGIITVGPSWAILGRLTVPGTPAAATALLAVSSGINAGVINTAQTTTSTTYTDLATVGPSATVTIRGSGKALVIMSAQLAFAEVSTQETGAAASFTASGANTIAVSPERSINMYMSVAGPPPSIGLTNQYGATFYLDNLNPGVTTFTMKYRTQVVGKTSHFSDRVLVVWPL